MGIAPNRVIDEQPYYLTPKGRAQLIVSAFTEDVPLEPLERKYLLKIAQEEIERAERVAREGERESAAAALAHFVGVERAACLAIVSGLDLDDVPDDISMRRTDVVLQAVAIVAGRIRARPEPVFHAEEH